ncbi:MAG: NADH-quinone oxidoreductase subunit NuoG [Deltaproteobacteria bacterium]|nr:NADH-quinone oxidoreductase subunit NuoG [Deltaproteobacteria bacterium]
MPVLTIDNRVIEVPQGTNVLEAAKMLEIYIPHLCFHEGLGAVGSCRLCAVKFLDGPVKGVQMSCMVQAQDGMVVSTIDQEAQEMRRHVMEWLMMNHPHDCPVCDTGGECPLQEMTQAAGHAVRRYRGTKRTWQNQDLGPFVHQEMNRCIRCYRCVRTYQDVCGGTDFGALGARQRVVFGRFREGRLESPFSGNLIDVCPTGVFTDKVFRFKARHWDLQEAPSVCPSCSLGCAIVPGARYHEMARVRAGVHPEINGHFICDRGRFAFSFTNLAQRPRLPLVNHKPVPWLEALNKLQADIDETITNFGPESIAFVGSNRASLESNTLLRFWAERLGIKNVLFESHPQRDLAARVVAARLGQHACSLKDVRKSDLIILVGADPLNEAPMSALAIRQAVLSGAHAAVIDPRPVVVPFEAEHLVCRMEQLEAVLKGLSAGDFSVFENAERQVLEGLFRRLQQARNPVLMGGADFLGGGGVDLLLAAAGELSAGGNRPCGAMLFLSGPNSYGGALLSQESPIFDEIVKQALEGKLKILVCLENDFLNNYPEPGLAETARSHLSLLAVIDYVPSASAASADIFLPSAAPAEQEGVFVNNEGRMQAFRKVLVPGIPLREIGHGSYPPRVFGSGQASDQPREAREILASVLGMEASCQAVRSRIERAERCFAGLSDLEPESGGLHVSGFLTDLPQKKIFPGPHLAEKYLALVPINDFFGSSLLAAFSDTLQPLGLEPHILLHPRTAGLWRVSTGEKVRLVCEQGNFEVRIKTASGMSEGTVFLPHLRNTTVGLFVPGGSPVPCTLEKLE